MQVFLDSFAVHLLPKVAAFAVMLDFEPSAEDHVIDFSIGRERRRLGFEAEELGLRDEAVVA